MPREVEPPTLQSDFVLTSLRASPPIRVDGRSPMQARDPELTFGDSLGWVECRMGKTRSSEEEVILTRMIEKIIRRSEAVDREALCILAGQQVWALRLTIHVLSDEGNMLDCACLAAVTALRHFRRPDVEVVGDEVIIVGIRFSALD
ncbi:3'-5'-exoribonuclease [Rhizoctonia solani]